MNAGKWPEQPDRRERRGRTAAVALRVLLPVAVGASYLLMGWRGVVIGFVVAALALAYSFVDDSHRRRREQRERHQAETQRRRVTAPGYDTDQP